jgi:hypothetical protein
MRVAQSVSGPDSSFRFGSMMELLCVLTRAEDVDKCRP